MNYHIIINGCSADYVKEAKEIKGFLSACRGLPEAGSSIIIYRSGFGKEKLIEAAPTKKVILIEVKAYQPEVILKELTTIMKKDDIYLFGSGNAGWELSVRSAKRMKGSSMTCVNRLEFANGQMNAGKTVYSNHMQGIFQLHKAPFCICVAKGFEEELKPSEHEIVEEIDASASKEASFVNFSELEEEEQKDDLESAKLLLVAGRGVNGKEKIEELGRIAEKLQGKFGVTRPVAMNAWAPMKQLIGVSGSIVKPKICITAGISGAAAFYAGIEKSGYIISINSNEKAPIIKKADIAIIDDYEKVIKALAQMLEERTVEDGR